MSVTGEEQPRGTPIRFAVRLSRPVPENTTITVEWATTPAHPAGLAARNCKNKNPDPLTWPDQGCSAIGIVTTERLPTTHTCPRDASHPDAGHAHTDHPGIHPHPPGYITNTGKLVFHPGQTTKHITINTCKIHPGDHNPNTNQKLPFGIQLTNPQTTTPTTNTNQTHTTLAKTTNPPGAPNGYAESTIHTPNSATDPT